MPEVRHAFTAPFRSQWIFDVEMLARYLFACGGAAHAGTRIYELPLTTWRDVPGSKLKLRHAPRAIRDLVRISREMRRPQGQ
jgi:hypothetical protein